MPTKVLLNEHQRERYERAYYRLLGALTVLDEMVNEYPAPEVVMDAALAYELEDLSLRIEALTALHVGIPA